MKATIDKAGRMVIPAPIRKAAGWTAGTEVEIEVDETRTVRITSAAPPMKLARRKGRWIAVPQMKTTRDEPIDIARLIREERDRWPF